MGRDCTLGPPQLKPLNQIGDNQPKPLLAAGLKGAEGKERVVRLDGSLEAPHSLAPYCDRQCSL